MWMRGGEEMKRDLRGEEVRGERVYEDVGK
jgi:hypothetical protein